MLRVSCEKPFGTGTLACLASGIPIPCLASATLALREAQPSTSSSSPTTDPPPLVSLSRPTRCLGSTHCPNVGSYGVAFSYERGTPVTLRSLKASTSRSVPPTHVLRSALVAPCPGPAPPPSTVLTPLTRIAHVCDSPAETASTVPPKFTPTCPQPTTATSGTHSRLDRTAQMMVRACIDRGPCDPTVSDGLSL